ncbi:MAG TPA: hypothetical protein VFN67_36430 [Polyangiales bacterium]|nr:hypothetical protein [Polyangiales bacterium]
MTRSKAYAAAATAAAVAAVLLLASSSPAKAADDELLSPRMRELKRLRAELARLQAEIPNASNARKLAIEAELGVLDSKLEALLKANDNQAPGAINGWTPLLDKSVRVEAGRTYAAVVQLTGLAAVFAGTSNVESKLRAAAPWQSLQVSTEPLSAAAQVPWTREKSSGRFWVLGIPASAQTLERPAELLELFTRD